MIAPPGGAILAFRYNMRAPRFVEEALSIYPDGSCWRWILGGKAQTDRVGTYQIALPTGEKNQALELATALAQAAPPPPPATPSGAQLTISVSVGGASRQHVIYEGDPHAPPAFNPARQFADKVSRLTERGPQAVLVMTVQAKFPARQGRGSVSYIFENIGGQPIGVLFNGTSFGFDVLDKGNTKLQAWSASDAIGGLTTADMTYLDGVQQAATVPAHTRAATAFVDAVQPPQQRQSRLSARTSGFVTLRYPGMTAADYPGDGFALEASTGL